MQRDVLRCLSQRRLDNHGLESVGQRGPRAMHAPGDANGRRGGERERVVENRV